MFIFLDQLWYINLSLPLNSVKEEKHRVSFFSNSGFTVWKCFLMQFTLVLVLCHIDKFIKML